MLIKILDLFCGCGGMSWGLHKSNPQFEIIAGIDNDEVALKTFQKNHPTAIASTADLSQVDPLEWLDHHSINHDEIDMIIGGPPCQGFSKNVPRSQRYLDDERNQLVNQFLGFVDAIRPRIVLMENVAEIVNSFDGEFNTEIVSCLEDWGYFVDVKVLDVADYGVPQHRRRAFYFASLDKLPHFPEKSHYSSDDKLPLFDTDTKTHVTVWEAIGDLPGLQHGEEAHIYDCSPFSDYQILMRSSATSRTLFNHQAKKLSDLQFARLSSLQSGEDARHLPKHLQPKRHYSGAYGRLAKNSVARTITRWMFHTGSGRYGHPVDIRTITIREGARLQSFTDDFVFEGTFTQASSQLGNAVPPLIMSAFAPIILEHFTDKQLIIQDVDNR